MAYTDFDPYADERRKRRTPLAATGAFSPTETVDTGIPASYGTSTTGIPQTSQSPQSPRYQMLVDAYQRYLGRTPSQTELYSHAGSGAWAENDPRLEESYYNIMVSPEARAYAERQQAGTQPATQPATVPSFAPTALAGWDQTKWANPAHTTPKYVVGRILSQYDPSPAGLQQALPSIQSAFPGTTLMGTDKLQIPGVGLIDVGGNFNSGGSMNWWWGDTSAPSGVPATATGAVASTAGIGTGGLGTGGGGYGAPSTYGDLGFENQIRAKLLALLGQSPTNISTNPVYTGALDAYRTEQQRAMERERNAIAERMAAEGTLNSGGFDTRVLAAEQQAGENTASFAGQLGVRELERQRDEIMQALAIGAGLLSDDQRLALSEKLGLINAELQQQQIINQNNQFNQNLGWDMSQFQWLQNLLPYMIG